MFVVKCPKCKRSSKAFLDHAGLQGKCPHCGVKVKLVGAEGEAATEGLELIQPLPGSVPRSQRKRVHLPDTSPHAKTLFFVALAATWAFFFLGGRIFAEPGDNRLWSILMSCGWIGRVEIFLFLWGALLLASKGVLWLSQRRSLTWNVFPESFSGETKISPSDVDACIAHIHGLARQPRRSILLNRLCLGLDHLRLTRDVQEVRGALTGQSAIDANLLDASYTILRFLVWVIPIVGFLGTVIGIGLAVSDFAGFIPEVADMEEAMDSLRQGLGQVTSGLGTAFNTTMVALLLVAPLMFLTASLRKREEHLLAEIDQFSNHDLLAKLTDTETASVMREEEPEAALTATDS